MQLILFSCWFTSLIHDILHKNATLLAQLQCYISPQLQLHLFDKQSNESTLTWKIFHQWCNLYFSFFVSSIFSDILIYFCITSNTSFQISENKIVDYIVFYSYFVFQYYILDITEKSIKYFTKCMHTYISNNKWHFEKILIVKYKKKLLKCVYIFISMHFLK